LVADIERGWADLWKKSPNRPENPGGHAGVYLRCYGAPQDIVQRSKLWSADSLTGLEMNEIQQLIARLP
jgi:hypothetical protein